MFLTKYRQHMRARACVYVLKGEGGGHYFLECELPWLLNYFSEGRGVGGGWSKLILTAKLSVVSD